MNTTFDGTETPRAIARLNRWLAVPGLALVLSTACAKSEPKPAPAIASAAATPTPGLPANVDGKLLAKLKDLSKTCAIDVRESNVNCENRGLEALHDQIMEGARSQSRSLDTVAYALAEPDPKLVTVAAEFLQLAFRAPVEEKDPKPTSKETALSLIKTLSKLPDQQALDAGPAVVFAATRTGTESELYQAVENHPYKRLISRTYKYLMAAGGMKVWSKVQELAKSDQVEVVLSALDAPTLFREKTPADQKQVCDWYKSLVYHSLPIVATRASGYLIVCGPDYIEQLLTADEGRLKDPKLTTMALGTYQQMCVPVIAATGPTPEQCSRLRKMLMTVLEDKRFVQGTRMEALTLLTVNFSDKDTLTVMKKFEHDKDPLLAQRASDAAVQITGNLARAAKQKAEAATK